ncbi:MAG: tRNA uridine(34) 5-carboxymethylaminomethyl modification radical SAM/GNAT enzyme Elp3 [Candidatus Nanoarchaeia archaeon]|nr:tRNA uridine(34) 5-carboxymethylaminomethyl modification radical SAM/GNAT enzyme Elp3 [Candidatus Nanoarchaeia archaeon]MDD5357875.1 tRNA uridine(34) 5-carboxymethylaminomethyl modification radical SAM/GNAT enzyme Elp3 [Candidatus Nanoarchaeia archaeon]MDD5588794.1 tRNA uridine(34) 5-carboxymethylaminomethyl modification radical SAM/GNAT enzyme Elp3 [Candidatus Nanoarchaeia archaeon]
MLTPKKNEVRKPTKTISGITPVAVMLPPRACEHGTCLYCPSLDVPQSYTPKSPVVMRASEVGYDSYKQVLARIKAFEVMNHPTEKVELIIMGGTFLEYPKKFQYDFVKKCYDALNGKISKTLNEAQKLNEKARHRCVALCVETRPDECIKYIKQMRDFGVTRVELGVQMPDDKIYKIIKRGHKVKDVVDATRELKNAGFKVGYHIMPGLPGSNPKKDLQLFKKLFSDEKFKPDQLKIYPCQVIRGSKLEDEYWKKKYKPYTKEQTEKLLTEMMKVVPRYCRVMRVMREIPPDYLVAGTTRIDLRKDVEEKLRRENKKIVEIRFREIGFAGKGTDNNLKLKITKYKASGSDEYFLEIVNDDDILFGLLRLRIVGTRALVRELHVYGQSLKLGDEGKVSQHIGLGKWLMKEAEKIAEKNKCKKILVISGIGVREYYRKLGYDLEDSYMIKIIR